MGPARCTAMWMLRCSALPSAPTVSGGTVRKGSEGTMAGLDQAPRAGGGGGGLGGGGGGLGGGGGRGGRGGGGGGPLGSGGEGGGGSAER